MEKNAIKRIINKDIKELNKLNLNSLGIYIEFNEENLLEAKAMIVGPKDSLYEGGFLLFNINFPKNYPFAPPDVTYVSRNNIRIHPNIYVGSGTKGFGKVCLSILGTWSGPKWTSVMDITTVLLCIQSLLDNDPLHHEPGHENNNTDVNSHYNEIIKYETINTLFLKNKIDIPLGFEIFKTIIDEKSKENKEHFLKIINGNIQKSPNTFMITCPIYRIQLRINYKDLLLHFNHVMNE